MNSRTSFSTISRFAPNSRLIVSTMSSSDHPLSRSSRILDPTGFRLNICPWWISRTIAPSWPCVLRTPSDTLYKGDPTTAIHFSNHVWHTLPLVAVERPLICEFVRETIRGFRTRLPLQRHASVASGFTEIEYVRVSNLVDWSLAGIEIVLQPVTNEALPSLLTNGISECTVCAPGCFHGLTRLEARISSVSIFDRESGDC
jgi:hypothetical protein